jgi:hypothetical protein
MGIERVALNPSSLRQHGESGLRRAEGAVQIDCCFDDPAPCFGLPLCAALEGVFSRHLNLVARNRAFIVDRRPYFDTQMCTIKMERGPYRIKADGLGAKWKRRSRKCPTEFIGCRLIRWLSRRPPASRRQDWSSAGVCRRPRPSHLNRGSGNAWRERLKPAPRCFFYFKTKDFKRDC